MNSELDLDIPQVRKWEEDNVAFVTNNTIDTNPNLYNEISE